MRRRVFKASREHVLVGIAVLLLAAASGPLRSGNAGDGKELRPPRVEPARTPVPASQIWELSQAPTMTAIDDTVLSITTSLSLNCMPDTTVRNRQAGASIRIRTVEVGPADEDKSQRHVRRRPAIAAAGRRQPVGPPFPAGVTVDGVWFLNGNRGWRAGRVSGRCQDDELVISAGDCPPTWKVVDVVVRLQEESGRLFLIRAPEQQITRSY
ncbi:MAG: hypothetical protein ACYSWT_03450 [Planctomycetota bacterium]|jgi:hypothetical protein